MKDVLRTFYTYRFIFCVSAAYMLVAAGAAFYLGAKPREFSDVIGYFLTADFFMLFYPLMILGVYFLRAVASVREKTPGAWIKSALAHFDEQVVSFFKGGAFWHGLAALAVILPIDMFFCAGKSLIPHVSHYMWDPAWSALDKFIHFGRYPHEYLVPLADRFSLAPAIDKLYLAWFIMVFMVQGFCFFADHDPVRRMRYLWTTVLSWILVGTVMAALMASVGPVYYADFYAGVSPYQSLVDYLHRAGEGGQPLKAVSIAADLLQMVRNDTVVDLNAISAMPSLHVGIAFLSVLYFYSINRVAWAMALGYFFVILGGSVLLGWHYAADGYVAVAAVWGLWRLTKPLVRALHPELIEIKGGVG